MTTQTFKTLTCFVCGLLWFSVDQVVHAQKPEFPYRATVIGDEAIVRSGPGTTHYGTDRLRPGTQVQVFRHDPGGWIAIRPPSRSFSLIQRDEIELYENGLAKVIEQETVAWVGTRLNAVKKPLWQVKLRAGEMLEVLGVVDRQQYKLDQEEPDWVQIQPPAGEFRWIAATDIRADTDARATSTGSGVPSVPAELTDAGVDGLRIDLGNESGFSESESSNSSGFQNERPANVRNRNSNPGTPTLAPTQANPDNADPNQPTPFDSWEPSQNPGEWTLDVEPTGIVGSDSTGSPGFDTTSSIAPANTGWAPARQTITNFVNERSGFMAESSTGGMYTNDWANQAIGSVSQPTMNTSIRSDIFDATDTSGYGSGNLQSPKLLAPEIGSTANSAAGGLLQSLEMRLTQEMIKPPEAWDLTALATEVERARAGATNSQDAAFLDRLMEKIRNCREIKAGFRATGGGGTNDLQTRRNPGVGNGTGGYTANNQANGQDNLLYDYDAHGILNELVRDSGTGPTTFVLQDARGKITHHISAPPGVNLRRYLNQRVGIIGNRGFHQQLKLDHVTAERVISIDTLRR